MKLKVLIACALLFNSDLFWTAKIQKISEN